MKNAHLEVARSKIKISIRGKNINKYILKLRKNKIDLLNIAKSNKEEIEVLIYFRDYERVLELNTTYKISIIEYGGWAKTKQSVHKNAYLFISILMCFVFLFILSKMIFNVEVVTNDKAMQERLIDELKARKISKFRFQKSFNEITKIKESILNEYREEIEWIEIQLVGTKYIIRYEPRIMEPKKTEGKARHLIAKKNAIILSVESSQGQVIKRQNDYVDKGDIIVSGDIYLYDKIKDTVSASGTVYGEVWYEVEVFYPFSYHEQTRTGRTKTIYSIKFLHWNLSFDTKPFKDKLVMETVILKNHALPISFSKECQEEVNTISAIYTVEEASLQAIDLAIKKIELNMSDEEEILKYKILSQNIDSNGVKLKLFFSVKEDITDYVEIIPEIEKEVQ